MRTLIAILLCGILIGHSASAVVAETHRTKHKPVILEKTEEKKSNNLKWIWVALGTLAGIGLIAVVAGGGGGGGGNGGNDNNDVSVIIPPLRSQ